MKEPYDQGLANQIGPAPCADVREGMGEASVRGSAGWVSSRETFETSSWPGCARYGAAASGTGCRGRQCRSTSNATSPRPVSCTHGPKRGSASDTRCGSLMRYQLPPGSVRGAVSNDRPYRD